MGEHCRFAPADYLQAREPILVDHAEVLSRVAKDRVSRMRLEAKQDLQERGGRRRTAGDMKEMSTRRNYSRNLSHALAKRNVFEGAARYNEIERVVREGK